MERIRYRKIPDRPGVVRSNRSFISDTTYASYHIVLDKLNKRYMIMQEMADGTTNMVASGETGNLAYLQGLIRKELAKFGITLETEVRK